MSLNPDQLTAVITEAGDDWADKQAAAELLEETRKSVLAALMVEAGHSSMAGKEMQALADPVYKRFVEGMVNARKAANKARVRYDSAKVLAELRRSQESTRRAEIGLR